MSEVVQDESVPESELENSQPEGEIADETPPSGDAEKPKSRYTLRVEELSRRATLAEQRAAAAEERANTAMELALRQKESEPPAPDAPKTKPTVDQFASYEEFTEALADWKVGEILERRENAQREAQAATSAEEQKQVFWERAQKFALDVPDFDAVVAANERRVAVSKAMAEAIQGSEMGPALYYHLLKNPQVSQQIARLPPGEAGRQLGRLEAQLTAPKPKTISGAPEPINSLLGGNSGSSVADDKMSAKDWIEKRNRELYGKR